MVRSRFWIIESMQIPSSPVKPRSFNGSIHTNISNPAPNSFGTCHVGNIRGPDYANVDLSLHKDFLFTETKRLEFRFEGLNAFNHPVLTFFGGPANGSFDPGTPLMPGGPSSNFGRIADAQGARQLQFALKFFF